MNLIFFLESFQIFVFDIYSLHVVLFLFFVFIIVDLMTLLSIIDILSKIYLRCLYLNDILEKSIRKLLKIPLVRRILK